MDILELVRQDLSGATLERQYEVAAATGVPWGTLRKIIDRDTLNPRYNTVEALRAYYDANPPTPRETPAADARA